MAGRQNPQHDRVTLSAAERRALAELELAYADRPYSGRRGCGSGRSHPFRRGVAWVWLRLARLRAWIAAVGAVLVLAAFAPPVVLIAVGAVCVVVCVVACVVPAARGVWSRRRGSRRAHRL